MQRMMVCLFQCSVLASNNIDIIDNNENNINNNYSNNGDNNNNNSNGDNEARFFF